MLKIRNWTIKRTKSGVCVEGILDINESGERWHSNTIKHRISNKVVKTLTGSCYRLVGKLSAGLDSSVPIEILKKFSNGFPDNWEMLIENWHGLSSSPGLENLCGNDSEPKLSISTKKRRSKATPGVNQLKAEAKRVVNESADCILTGSVGIPQGNQVVQRSVIVSQQKLSTMVDSMERKKLNARKRQSMQNSDNDASMTEQEVRVTGSPDEMSYLNEIPLQGKCKARRRQSKEVENLNLTAEAMAVLCNDSLIDLISLKRKAGKHQSKKIKNLDLTAEAMAVLSDGFTDSTLLSGTTLHSTRLPVTGRVKFKCLKDITNTNRQGNTDVNMEAFCYLQDRQEQHMPDSGDIKFDNNRNKIRRGVASCLMSPPNSTLSDTRLSAGSSLSNTTLPTDFLLTALETTSPLVSQKDVMNKLNTPASIVKLSSQTVIKSGSIRRRAHKSSSVSFLSLKRSAGLSRCRSSVTGNGKGNRLPLMTRGYRDTIRNDSINKTHDISDIICRASLPGLSVIQLKKEKLLAGVSKMPYMIDKGKSHDHRSTVLNVDRGATKDNVTAKNNNSAKVQTVNRRQMSKKAGKDVLSSKQANNIVNRKEVMNVGIDGISFSGECANSEAVKCGKNIMDNSPSESDMDKYKKNSTGNKQSSRKRKQETNDMCLSSKRLCNSSIKTANIITTEQSSTPSRSVRILRSASRLRKTSSPCIQNSQSSTGLSTVKSEPRLQRSQNSVCKTLKKQFLTKYGNKSIRVICSPLGPGCRSSKSRPELKVGNVASIVKPKSSKRGAVKTPRKSEKPKSSQHSKLKQAETDKVAVKNKKVTGKEVPKSVNGEKSKDSAVEMEHSDDVNIVVADKKKVSDRKRKSFTKKKNIPKGNVGSISGEDKIKGAASLNKKTKKVISEKSVLIPVSTTEQENFTNSQIIKKSSEYYSLADDSEIILKVPRNRASGYDHLCSNPRVVPSKSTVKSISLANLANGNDMSLIGICRSAELNLSIEGIPDRGAKFQSCFKDGIRTSTPRRNPVEISRNNVKSAEINDSVQIMSRKITSAADKIGEIRQQDEPVATLKRHAMKDIAKANKPGVLSTDVSGKIESTKKDAGIGKKDKVAKVSKSPETKKSVSLKVTEDDQDLVTEVLPSKASGKKSTKGKVDQGGGLGGKGTLKRRKNLRQLIKDHDDEMSACDDIFVSTPYGQLKEGKLADMYGKELTDLTMLTLDGSCMTGSVSRTCMTSMGLTPHRMLMGSMYDSSSIQKTPFDSTPAVPGSRLQNMKHIDNFINGVLKERQRKYTRRKLTATDVNDSGSAIPLSGVSTQMKCSSVDLLRPGPAQANFDPEESIDNYFDETLE